MARPIGQLVICVGSTGDLALLANLLVLQAQRRSNTTSTFVEHDSTAATWRTVLGPRQGRCISAITADLLESLLDQQHVYSMS